MLELSIFIDESGSDGLSSTYYNYLCMIELAELRYKDGTTTRTYEKFLGGHQMFKKGPLKLYVFIPSSPKHGFFLTTPKPIFV